MRYRYLVALVAACILTLGGFDARQSPTVLADSPRDKAVGSFKGEGGDIFEIHARFSAHSGPAGEDPKGHANVDFTEPAGTHRLRGELVCLAVSGNVAQMIFRLREPVTFGTVTVNAFVLFVQDNGPPGSDPPDDVVAFAFANIPAQLPAGVCPAFGAVFTHTHGNVNVHDATP